VTGFRLRLFLEKHDLTLPGFTHRANPMQETIEPIRWRETGNLAENLGVRGSVDRAGIEHGVSMLDALKKTDQGSDVDGRAAFSACDHPVSKPTLHRSSGNHTVATIGDRRRLLGLEYHGR
jgi:hypothetical protein